MSENKIETTEKRRAIWASMFSDNSLDDVSFESSLHSNHTFEDTYEVIDGDDDVQFQVVEKTEVVDEAVEITNNAPTTKVQNMVEYGSGLSTTSHSRAEEVIAGYETADYDKPYARFTLTFVYDALGNFKTEEYETIQELANAMRDIADLRTWRKFEPES